MNRRFTKKLLAVALLITILMVPSSAVYAETSSEAEDSATATSTAIGSMLYWVLSGVIKILAGISTLLDYFVRYSVNPNTGAILEMWRIVRDFCNMFFILILVVLSFATIFDVGGYKISSGVLGKLLIAALLINFSLAIGGLFIKTIDKVNLVFLNGMGSLSDRVGQSFDASQLLNVGDQSIRNTLAMTGKVGCYLTAVGTYNIGLAAQCRTFDQTIATIIPDTYSWNESFRILFSIILLGIAGSGLLVATFFAIIRIPFLWVLLVFSPIAVLASILPSTQATWERWKKEFISWNVFLPIYLFFLYFGFYLLARQNELITNIAGFPNETFTTPIPGLGFPIQFIFVYIVIGIVFWFGTISAVSIARSFGGMASEYGATWSQSITSAIPGISHTRAISAGISDAALDRVEKIKKEGFFGRGGQLGLDRLQAKVAGGLGVTGARESQLAKEVKYLKDEYNKENLNAGALWEITKKGRKQEQLAAFERLKELKQLGGEDMLEAFKLYGPTTKSGLEWAKDVDFEKLTRGERQLWFDDRDVPDSLRYRLADAMAKEGEIGLKWNDKSPTGAKLTPPIEDLGDENKLFRMAKIIDRDNTNKDLLATDPLKAREKANKMLFNFLINVAKKNPAEALRVAEKFKVYDPTKDPVTDPGAYVSISKDLIKNLRKRKASDWLGILNPDLFTKPGNELNDTQLQLRNDMIMIATERPKILEEIMKNRDITAEQRKAAEALEGIVSSFNKPGFNPPPPAPPGTPPRKTTPDASDVLPVSAPRNPKNTIDLRKI